MGTIYLAVVTHCRHVSYWSPRFHLFVDAIIIISDSYSVYPPILSNIPFSFSDETNKKIEK